MKLPKPNRARVSHVHQFELKSSVTDEKARTVTETWKCGNKGCPSPVDMRTRKLR